MKSPRPYAVLVFSASGLLAISPVPPPVSSSPPPAKVDSAAKLEKCRQFFEECRSALAELPLALSNALEASIQEERLQKKKGEEKGGRDWRCETTLRKAKDRSTDQRAQAGSIVQRAKNKWSAATGAGRDLPAEQLPWGPMPEDRKAINDALTRANALFKSIDSAQSSAGPKRLASIWRDAQEYEAKQPKQLPPAKAEAIVPQRVQVPCIEESVNLR